MNFIKKIQKKWNDFYNKEVEWEFEIVLGLEQIIFGLILILGLLWIIFR